MRVTQSWWITYCISREFKRIYTYQRPKCLFERLDSQSYRTNCPPLVKFYENSSLKIGKQSFGNKVVLVSWLIDFDWYYTWLSSDSFRIKLKSC